MERRRFERQEHSGRVQIERRAESGGVAGMAVFLKEMSLGGFSGTYVGPALPARQDALSWRHEDGAATPLRMVWARRSCDCVYDVGFEVLVAS